MCGVESYFIQLLSTSELFFHDRKKLLAISQDTFPHEALVYDFPML